jgi:phage tail sheath protein FI
MPSSLSYPGVYIQEVPSGVRAITGVATSITAFIGRALRGAVDEPVQVSSFGEFQRSFGGLWAESTLGYAVYHYFLNGGTKALIVRVHNGALTASGELVLADSATQSLIAANPGAWGASLRIRIDHDTRPTDPTEIADSLFNLQVKDLATGRLETHLNLSIEASHSRFVAAVLAQESEFIRLPDGVPGLSARPAKSADPPPATLDPFDDATAVALTAGADPDGAVISAAEVAAAGLRSLKRGLYALEKADLFNLLVIPPYTRDGDVDTAVTIPAAQGYCRERRAIYLVDPPNTWSSVAAVQGQLSADLPNRDANSAVYFPKIKATDPLNGNQLQSFAPSGAVAGVIARTDAARGVWHAPAGIDAALVGALGLSVDITNTDNGVLNPLGVNCLRTFPNAGRVVWGSRTLQGADNLASEWKYLPVRRLGLFIEESLCRGIQWAVFEPNEEPLWAQIRLNVGSFMQNLFRQGAFQGRTPREAYFVKCDAETTTPNDVNLGVVNILVGFAPLKPAEFIVIKIQQMAGQGN